jgi:hypothetical protein
MSPRFLSGATGIRTPSILVTQEKAEDRRNYSKHSTNFGNRSAKSTHFPLYYKDTVHSLLLSNSAVAIIFEFVTASYKR